MTQAGISIVVPLHNKASYVDSTLEALGRQISADDELIVVDDGSTDGSEAIAQRHVGERVQVMRLEENAGPATARNRGAQSARGEFLLFFDADDDPHPDLLVVLRNAIMQSPAEAIFCFNIAHSSRGERFDSTLDPGALGHGALPEVLPIDAFAHSVLAGRPLCTASSTCVRRSVFMESGGFLAGLRYCEDPELWVRLSSCHPIVHIPVVLANYREVPHSLSQIHRIQIGAVEPYVNTLKALASGGPPVYAALAFEMLKKNVAFGRAGGATIGEARRCIGRNRHGFDSGRVAILRVICFMPAALMRLLLRMRNWNVRRTAAHQVTDAY
jgi:hypothetical protein